MSLRGRIAVIGWGSLIWDLDDLAPKVEGPWRMGGGPVLPMEFSRVSPKRLQALAVCLDPKYGDPCQTNAIVSFRSDIQEAAEDLRARERAQRIDQIGLVHPATGALHTRIPELGPILTEWCEATGAAGAVWTDLDDNFEKITGTPFTTANATAYLNGLTGASREEAVRYITLAPAATDTPLRRALKAQSWWQDEAAAVVGQV